MTVLPMRQSNWSLYCRRCRHPQIGQAALASECKEIPKDSFNWRASMATKQCFEWVADGKELSIYGFQTSIANAVQLMRSANAVAKSFGLDHKAVRHWLAGAERPRLATIVRDSVNFDIPIQKIFQNEALWTRIPLQATALPGRLYTRRLERGAEALKATLEEAVSDKLTEPPSLSQVCSRFHVSKPRVRQRFPELMDRLIAKHRAYIFARKATRERQLESRLDQLIKDLEREGGSVSAYHIRKLMRSRGEGQTFRMLRLFRLRQKVSSQLPLKSPLVSA